MKGVSCLLAFIVAGCAASGGVSIESYAEIASKHLGKEFQVEVVEASGAIADATFIAASNSSGASHQSKGLSERLVVQGGTPLFIAVVGDNPSKTAVVVREALKLMSAGSGAGSKVVCFCASKYRGEISDAATAAGVEVFYETI